MSDDTDADPVDDGAADDADAEAGTEDVDAETGAPAEAGTEAEAEDDAGEDGLAEGDFVRLAYTARTVEEGNLVDTTDPEAAEEADVDTEDQEFSPRVLALGSGQLFESVEDDIVGREAGEEGSVVVPAGEAFGEYDPEDVRTVSVDRLPEDDRYPGAHVDIDGEHGHVQTIVGSRARVDFNHPLAGEDIEYEYEILGRVDDRVEQAQGMLQTYVDADLEMHIETEEVEEEVPVEDGDEDGDGEPETETELREVETLYIESTPELQFDQQWMFSKQQVAQQIIDRLGIDRVVIQETIEAQPSPMGGMGGMMGGGDVDLGDLEEAIDESDADAEDVLDELDVDEADVEEADEAAEDTEE